MDEAFDRFNDNVDTYSYNDNCDNDRASVFDFFVIFGEFLTAAEFFADDNYDARDGIY